MTKRVLVMLTGLILAAVLCPEAKGAEDYTLTYFLGKVGQNREDLTKKERDELLHRMQGMLERVGKSCDKLAEVTQEGEGGFRYDEGKFWMARLARDRESVETGMKQLKLLKEKPGLLVASITLYKSMRDLANSLNAYNHVTAFCPYVGELASEVELWADPVFYKGYLLPLAKSKDAETKPPQKEKGGSATKSRKPQSPPSRSKNP